MICVNSIKITPDSIRLQTGKWYNSATVEISPANATCKSVTWSSSNSDIASVNPISGQVLANATGTATIVATACDESGKKGSYVVTVTDDILVASVTVYPAKKTLVIGDSCFLSAIVCPENAANNCVRWVSSDENIAKVNINTGYVTAIRTGTATISAIAYDGSRVFGSCEVTVGQYFKLVSTHVYNDGMKALSVDGKYLLNLGNENSSKENETGNENEKKKCVCLNTSDDSNEQIWKINLISDQNDCYVSSCIDEDYGLSNGDTVEVIAKNTAVCAFRFILQGNGAYRVKSVNSAKYLTASNDGKSVAWETVSGIDQQYWNLIAVDMEQREAEKVEYFIIGNAGDGDALRVGDENHLDMTFKNEDDQDEYYDELKVFTEKKSFWNRQKWTIKGTGSTARIKTQLTDDLSREFFLCIQNESDAFVSCLATDEDSYMQIIPRDASRGLFQIKLVSQDLYLTCSGNNVFWGKQDENENSQIWKFETKPEYIHNGADTAGKLYRSNKSDSDKTIRALKLGGEEFVVRYYTSFSSSTKLLTKDEALGLKAHGIKVVAVYQDRAKYFKPEDVDTEKYEDHTADFTEVKAIANATKALALAKDVGQPKGTPIYFAVDANVNSDEKETLARKYFEKIAEVFKEKGNEYQIGVYGCGRICQHIKQSENIATYSWLSHSTGHRQHYEYDTPTKYNLKQSDYIWYNEVKFDDNVGVGDDFGQWYPEEKEE